MDLRLIFLVISISCFNKIYGLNGTEIKPEGRASYSWRASTVQPGIVPSNAVVGGYDYDKLPIYVGRVLHDNVWYPAKVVPFRGSAYFSLNGKEYSNTTWEYLVGSNFGWVRSYRGLMPPNPIITGYDDRGRSLFVGRQYHDNSLSVGKIVPDRYAVCLPYFGKEYCYEYYEVLVNPRCACAEDQWN